jgi:hypothetical protein
MSANMPRTIPELMSWCNTHVDLWLTNAVSIGITSTQAGQFKTAVGDMTTNLSKADAARQASKDATMTAQNSIDVVRSMGSAFIGIMKSYAETTHNPNVYALAGVSPNDPPSVLPAPVAPDKFGASVNPDGSLTIKWKVSQPTGVSSVVYLVSRRVNGGDGPFMLVSSEGSNKSFTDMTLPVGVDKVEYMVQPKRGTVFGPQSNVFAVQFGSVGGGGMSIATIQSVPHEQPMKIAA